MKVKELIAQLQQCEQEANVLCSTEDKSDATKEPLYFEIRKAASVTASTHRNSGSQGRAEHLVIIDITKEV